MFGAPAADDDRLPDFPQQYAHAREALAHYADQTTSEGRP